MVQCSMSNVQCTEIMVIAIQLKTKELHKKVKQATSRNTNSDNAGCIKDKDGNSLFDEGEIAQ